MTGQQRYNAFNDVIRIGGIPEDERGGLQCARLHITRGACCKRKQVSNLQRPSNVKATFAFLAQYSHLDHANRASAPCMVGM
jgi:hypothetical protein